MISNNKGVKGILMRWDCLSAPIFKVCSTLSTLHPPTITRDSSKVDIFPLRDEAGHGISCPKSQYELPEACRADTVLPSSPSTSPTPGLVANLGSQPMSSFNVSGNIFRKLSYSTVNKMAEPNHDFKCA